MKHVNVGVVGLGTVGGGVIRALLDKKSMLKSKTGLWIDLAKVFDKDTKRYAKMGLPRRVVARSLEDITRNKEIDIVVELIGGLHPAREIVETALRNGKHVVTANKALLASYGEGLFALAAEKGVSIGFEASVGGAMPVIKVIKESFAGNKISALYGIVNGTCNYVVTSMTDRNCSFKDALAEAQRKGLAEANPTLDIDGHDSCHKLAILVMLAFGRFVDPEDIYVEGVRNLDLQDITYARQWGYDIKLLAIAKRKGKGLEVRVHPTLIPLTHLLSAVKREDNAVFIKGDMIGESMIYGKGAGRFPAASAVVGDILDMAMKTGDTSSLKPFYTYSHGKGIVREVDDIGDLVTRYYVRLSAIDQPGVLASIASILAKNKISIATVSQKERKERQVVPIVMLTHDARESAMKKALKEINRLGVIKRKAVTFRIER